MQRTYQWRGLLAVGLVALSGCGAADEKSDAFGDGDPSVFDGGAGNGGANGGGTGGGGNGDSNGSDLDAGGLPPEEEESLSFERPQAGATSVYVPNPATDRVAIVNASTFAIETVKVGRSPTYTATVPGKDVAIVLNLGTRDASLLRTLDGDTQVTALPVGHDANAIAIAPDGEHAVIYYDSRDPNQTAQSFQDVTVVDLTPGKEAARGVSVGFRPRAVTFSADGDTAFVITEDGISIVDLNAADQGPVIARLVSLGDGLTDPLSVDVAITPNGKFALSRRMGETILRLISLEDGQITPLDLKVLQQQTPGSEASDAGVDAGADDEPTLAAGNLEITDVDVAPDGTFALAVARSHRALIRVPIPLGFGTPSLMSVVRVPDQLIGSVSIANTGKLAIVYTTAAPVEGVTLVSLDSSAPVRGVRLRKSVRAVALSNDGTRALILHDKSDGSPSDFGITEEDRIDRSEGYSLVDTASGFAKLQLTGARVKERDIVVTDDASRLFALLRDDNAGERSLQMADLGSFQVSTTRLVAPPSSIGIVPGEGRLFVGQELTGGMITFVDVETGAVQKAVTGFELTSRIRQ